MDKVWKAKTINLKEKEQWKLLYEQQATIKPEGNSIWLPKSDVMLFAGMLVYILHKIFQNLDIKTFVDVGCSDCMWQSKMDWSKVSYLGFDIVDELIEYNKKHYNMMKFETKNLIEDACPKADMIFIRNVLLHTPLDGIKKILMNVKRSGSKYLMASSLKDLRVNKETHCLGAVRRNLEIEPFNLPNPIIYVPEVLPSELKGLNNYMGVWRTCDIPNYEV